MEWRKKAAYDFLSQTWAKHREFPIKVSASRDMASAVVEFPKENFSSMVILELLSKLELDIEIKTKILEFIENNYLKNNLIAFYEKGAPPDIESTALGITLLTEFGRINNERALDSMKKIIGNISQYGIPKLFFPPGKDSFIDAIACARVLYALHLYGKELEGLAIEDFLFETLQAEDETIVKMVPFYISPDALLYQLTRLTTRFPKMYKKFESPLRKKLKSRMGSTENILDLAMRTITANTLGISNKREAEKIVSAQSEEGSWHEEAYFTFGNVPRYNFYGSKELSTAFCIHALESLKIDA